MSRLLLGLLVAGLGGCGGDPTEILVVVDSNLTVPDEIDSVRIEVTGIAGGPQISTGVLAGPRSAEPLPRTLALVHDGGSLGPIHVRAQVLRSAGVVVERRASVSFVEGQIRVLHLLLDRDCLGVTCMGETTCARGTCRTVNVGEGELPRWNGEVPRRDAGGAGDGCPATGERCNGMDDDCDGRIDEGIDLMTDPANCGECGMRCMSPAGATSTCTAGACGFVCMAGFADCDMVPTNGCEGNLSAAETCGSCTNDCSIPNTTSSCDGTSCTVTGCDAGFGDCDGMAGNGCEQSLDTVMHCAACGTPCAPAGAVGTCAGGTCAIESCMAGFGDCDTMAANGCEAPLTTLADCGMCGMACSLANATATCATGTCAVESCTAGFGDCDAMGPTGCETPLNTLTDCGTCGTACAPANATGDCSTRACAIGTCNAGFDDCDSMAANGCEAVLASDEMNCGICGMTCPGAEVCVAGTCRTNAVLDVAGGGAHSCALLAIGTVECWGSNANGQLGDGTTTDRTTPVAVMGITDAIAVTAGNQHSCALRAGGTVVCWGANASGQLGDGTTMRRLTPVMVGGGLADAVQISAGGSHTCARQMSGAVSCWGENSEDQLGVGGGADRTSPTAVTGLIDAIDVSAGGQHTCAVRMTRGAVCWGRGNEGAIGDGTTMDRATPVAVSMVADAADIDAGDTHTCLVRTGGQVACWGSNSDGQLGIAGGGRTTPGAVAGIADAASISAGGDHTCARRTTSALACWGRNAEGQVGDGTTTQRNAPTAVMGVADAIAVATGTNHSCAARAAGGAVCWGANAGAQLGDGTRTNRSAPVAVMGLP